MAAPKGNKFGSHQKPWTRALEKFAHRNPDRLLKLAEKTFDLADKGDMGAVREIGDRLDGKPSQAITGADGKDFFPSEIGMRLIDGK